jgi:hypothetical protein
MAVNASKVRDPRYWKRWKRTGALGTLPKRTILSAPKENMPKVIVVFEYTNGSYRGGRFIVHYVAGDINRIKQEQEKPDSNTKIVAVNVSAEEAQRLCHEALLQSGVIGERLKHLINDPDVPPEMVEMETMNLFLATFLSSE